MWFFSDQDWKALGRVIVIFLVAVFGIGYGCHYLVFKAPSIKIEFEKKK